MSDDPANQTIERPARLRAWYQALDLLGRQRLLAAIGLAITLATLLGFLTISGSHPQELATPAAEPASTDGSWANLRMTTVANTILVAILLLSSPVWVRWAFAPEIESPPHIGRPNSKLSIFFLLAALAVASSLRLPLMDRPPQLAELDPLAFAISGYSDLDSDDRSEWQSPTWGQTFFPGAVEGYPALPSLASRATLEVWRKATGLENDRFHPVPVRLPSLIAGFASIVLIWRLLHWLGYRCAALFAAFFLAIHPAAIELDVRAGSASLGLFFELLAISSAYLALRTLKWRFWLIYGASMFCCLYANLGHIYFFIASSFFLAIYLTRRLCRARTRAAAWPQFVRCGIVSLLVAMGIFQVAAPARHRLPESAAGTHRTADTWQYLTLGKSPPTATTGDPQETPKLGAGAWLASLLISPALLLFGMLRLLRGNRFASPLVLAGLAAPVCAWTHAWLAAGHLPAIGQIVSALPIFILLFSIGITSLSDLITNRQQRPYFILASGAAYLIFFSLVTSVEAGPPDWPIEPGEGGSIEFERHGSRWQCDEDGRIIRNHSDEDKPLPRLDGSRGLPDSD
ncbi:MAG: glycosyltransferase family 39 protein [Verrucomicrobiales bacterium]